MTNGDAAAIAAVVAEHHLQDRRLAGARRSGQHDAFAGTDLEEDTTDHGQFDPTLQMHGEGLFGIPDLDHYRVDLQNHWAHLRPAGSRRRATGYRVHADRRAPGRSARSRSLAPSSSP